MTTAKKPVEKTETEEAPAEPVTTPEEPVGQPVCAVCGAPATRVSSSDAYSPAYYCAEHGNEEPLKDIGG